MRTSISRGRGALRRWSGLVAAWLLGCALIAACGAAPISGAGGSSGSSGQPVVAGDADNGKSFQLHVGDRLRVTLDSTYWTVNGSSVATVLRAEGPVVVSPSSGGCVPGAGCGTVTMIFDVIG